MTKGKLYYRLCESRVYGEIDSNTIAGILDEAKKEFPHLKEGSEYDYYDDREIQEWFKKWLGDEDAD